MIKVIIIIVIVCLFFLLLNSSIKEGIHHGVSGGGAFVGLSSNYLRDGWPYWDIDPSSSNYSIWYPDLYYKGYLNRYNV